MVGRTDALLDHLPTRAEPSTPRLWTARWTASWLEGRVALMMTTDGLRPIVEAVDREMSRLVARSCATGDDETALLTAWGALIEFLALGPPPELRSCPFCGSVGMRAATRCGSCWAKLAPSAPIASA